MGKHEVVQTLMMCSAQSCCGKNAKNTQNKRKPKKKRKPFCFFTVVQFKNKMVVNFVAYIQ